MAIMAVQCQGHSHVKMTSSKADELRFHGLEPNAERQGRSVAVAGECLSKPRSGKSPWVTMSSHAKSHHFIYLTRTNDEVISLIAIQPMIPKKLHEILPLSLTQVAMIPCRGISAEAA